MACPVTPLHLLHLRVRENHLLAATQLNGGFGEGRNLALGQKLRLLSFADFSMSYLSNSFPFFFTSFEGGIF
jgi:hypothetical protein